jgi:hypothetical protein
MKSIKISGKLTGQDFPHKTSNAYADILTVTCQQEVTLEALRSGGKSVELKDIDPDTLVELEFEGGFKRWVRAGDLRAQATQEASRSATSEFMLTPGSFEVSNQRGAVGLVLKFLRLLKVDPVSDMSDALSELLVDKLETRKNSSTRCVPLCQYRQVGAGINHASRRHRHQQARLAVFAWHVFQYRWQFRGVVGIPSRLQRGSMVATLVCALWSASIGVGTSHAHRQPRTKCAASITLVTAAYTLTPD